MMANRSDRGRGQPAECLGHRSPQSRMGPRPRKPSRPAVYDRANRPDTRRHPTSTPDRHRPPCNAGAIHTGRSFRKQAGLKTVVYDLVFPPTYLMFDGIHFTPRGYGEIAAQLVPFAIGAMRTSRQKSGRWVGGSERPRPTRSCGCRSVVPGFHRAAQARFLSARRIPQSTSANATPWYKRNGSPKTATAKIAPKTGTRFTNRPARLAPISSTPRMKRSCDTREGNIATYSTMAMPLLSGHWTVPVAISQISSGVVRMNANPDKAATNTKSETAGRVQEQYRHKRRRQRRLLSSKGRRC